MSDLIRKMIDAHNKAHDAYDHAAYSLDRVQEEAMRAALAVLADNVTPEMVRAASEDKSRDDEREFVPLAELLDFSGENTARTVIKSALSAAIREAGK